MYFSILHHFHFECGAHFLCIFFACWPEKLENQLCFSFYEFVLLLFLHLFLFWLHNERFACLFSFSYLLLFWVLSSVFCFIFLDAARCFPSFFVLPRHLSFPLPNTRTYLPSRSHLACVFATFIQYVCIYILSDTFSILFTCRLYVGYIKQFSRSFNLIY